GGAARGSGGRGAGPRPGTAPRGRPPRRARPRAWTGRATPPLRRARPVRPRGPARTERGALGARRLPSLEHELQGVLTLLAPGVELVRLEPLFPDLLRLGRFAPEPVGPAQLVVGLDEVGAELERLLEEGLRVLVHLALQVDEAEVEVRVQRRLLVVVEADRLGEVLDRLSEDALLQ